MTHMVSLCKEHILGKRYRGHDVSALGCIYYREFPYRVTMKFQNEPEARDDFHKHMSGFVGQAVQDQDLDFQELDLLRTKIMVNRAERTIKENLGDIRYRKTRRLGETFYDRVYNNRGVLTFFVPTQQALDIVLDYEQGKYVTKVEALHDQDHADMMTDSRFSTMKRKRKFYGDFLFKVDISTDTNTRNVDQRDIKDYQVIIADFMKHQANSNEYQIRTNWKKVTVFANQELVLEVLPMLRFNLNIGSYQVTRAVLSE